MENLSGRQCFEVSTVQEPQNSPEGVESRRIFLSAAHTVPFSIISNYPGNIKLCLFFASEIAAAVGSTGRDSSDLQGAASRAVSGPM